MSLALRTQLFYRPVVCVSSAKGPKKPKRSVVHIRDIKTAIDQARNLCYNYESSVECQIAWEKVEELSVAFDRQEKDIERFNEIEDRIYDL
jgi:glyoxylate carboligase